MQSLNNLQVELGRAVASASSHRKVRLLFAIIFKL